MLCGIIYTNKESFWKYLMKNMKKLTGLKLFVIIFCLTVAAQANASGFIFNWQLFVVNPDLVLGSPTKEISIKNSNVVDMNIPISDSKDLFSLFPDKNNDPIQKSEKKSVLSNIKITLSAENTFMITKDETYANSDDEKASKIVSAITSLIYGDSKKSWETMEKIVEPQINFYFEF